MIRGPDALSRTNAYLRFRCLAEVWRRTQTVFRPAAVNVRSEICARIELRWLSGTSSVFAACNL